MHIYSIAQTFGENLLTDIVASLSNLDKKTVAVAIGVFLCFSLSYYFFRFCRFNATPLTTEDSKIKSPDLLLKEADEGVDLKVKKTPKEEKVKEVDKTIIPPKQVIKEFRLELRTLNGKTISTYAFTDDSVADLYQRIQDKEGIPANGIILIYRGTRLEDDRFLDDYGINDFVTLHLMTKSRGD